MSQNCARPDVGIPNTYADPEELAPQLDSQRISGGYHSRPSEVEAGGNHAGEVNDAALGRVAEQIRHRPPKAAIAGANPAPISTEEEWRPTAGYPNYEVSNFGWVRRRGHVLRLTVFNRSTRGSGHYLGLCLSVGGKVKKVTVHSLVAAAFIGPRPSGMTIDHKNGVKGDNRVENLEYVTSGENTRRGNETRARRLGASLAATGSVTESALAAADAAVERMVRS